MFKITVRLFWLLSLLLVIGSTSLPAQTTRKAKAEIPVIETDRPSQLEQEVLTEINNLRQNPRNYARFLNALKNSIKDNFMTLPDGRRIRLNEGISAFDDAIKTLNKTKNLPPFGFSSGLSNVARTQMLDLRSNIKLGHFGKDGSNLEIRLLRIGVPGKEQSENISYYSTTARQIVLNMVLDETLRDRPHRKNLLSNRFNQIGISHGLTANEVAICVLVFNNNFREHSKKTGAIPVL